MDDLRDYVAVLPSTAAVATGFLAALVGNLFRQRPLVRAGLVTIAGLLAVSAVGTTLYSQHQMIAERDVAAKRNADIRKKLGDFIQQGIILVAPCRNEPNKEAPTDAVNAWLQSVNHFLDQELGRSYAQRLLTPAGGVTVECNPANPEYSKLFRIVMAVNAHLEQFSQQANF